MLYRPQDAEPPIMFHPSRPPSSSTHVLHRQPRLSSLKGQRGPDEERQGKLVHLEWLRDEAQHGHGHLSRQTTRHIKHHQTAFRNPGGEKGVDPETDDDRVGGVLRGSRIWDALPDSLDDVSDSVHPAPSENPRVATQSRAPPGAPRRWDSSRVLAYVRRSSEWETETLLNHSTGDWEVEMVHEPCPCPFRIRNPARFNIRDHEACAKAPFDSILGLRSHIITHHGRKPRHHQCRRCKDQFDTETALEEHLLLPRDQICEVNPRTPDDPEDGITDEIASTLAARSATEETQTWEGIWHLLFPSDPEVPEPDLHPVIELVEVQQAFDEGQDALKDSLRDKLQLLLPNSVDASYLGFLAGQIELVFETHRSHITKKALHRLSTTLSTVQPSQTGTQTSDPPRKPNRASRRSTLLQSLHRPPPDTLPSASRHSIRTTHFNPTKRASLLYNNNNTNRNNHQQPTPTLSPTTPKQLPARSSIALPIEPAQHPNPTTNSRESRDSGIGMPCEICGGGLDDEEPCCCDDSFGDEEKDEGNDESSDGCTTPGEGAVGLGLGLGLGGAGHLPRLRPGLGIGAGEEEEGGGHLQQREFDGEAWGGGRFSPASFKQRVLREGFHWVG